MNKTQLVDALASRIGDRRTAATAVDGLIETIVEAVVAGDSVSITGFGVFESRARAARVARNPRTGETVDVAATTVPAFRPGVSFRSAVGGNAPAPRATPARRRTAAAAPATNAVEVTGSSNGAVTDAAPAAEAAAAPAPRARRTARSGSTFAASSKAEAAAPEAEPAKADAAKGKGSKAKASAAKAPAKAAKDDKPKKGKGKK